LSLTLGPELQLVTTGPLAQACGEADVNLVLQAARLLADRVPHLRAGSFTLHKVLPVAAGIGGGSADAAAALRLLARANGLSLDDSRLIEVARSTGADVPVCVASRACIMTGVGETLLPLALPELPCVLVNPRVAVATRDVFEALGLRNGELLVGATDVIRGAFAWPAGGASTGEWIEALAGGSNDLEAPAIAIQPVVGDVLSVLAATDGARLVRMSGSGATCFAIFDSTAAAQAAAQNVRIARPQWWIHAGVLAGSEAP
jgi:4-diphosphocytidyl-2-C-methyl-D-erythritol kinase